jgi:predicted amidohydrolase YtcJ
MSPGPPPPLREAHAHIAMHGRALTTLRLHACTSVEACLDQVRAESARLDQLDPSGQRWLQATGLRVESWREPRWPTRDELDRVCPRRPASLMSFDHHALVANRPAFIAADIRDNDQDPEGGVIVRERSKGGTPTGLLLESACWKVRSAVPEPQGQERIDVVRAALDDLVALGFVEVHDLLAPSWLGATLAMLHDRSELRLRVGVFAPLAELESQHAASEIWSRPGHLEFLGGKIFVDGTLNARTAWMLAPYREPLSGHPTGTPLMTVPQIAEAIARCEAQGVGLAAHAIGDGAVRAVLDAASITRGSVRIEHAEIVDKADVARFAELGVIASLQPCHLLYDIEVLERQLPHRLDRVLPIRELLACGLVPGRTLLFGSDTPIVRPNPIDSVLASVHRRRTPDAPGGPENLVPIAPSQAIDEATAWTCFAAGQ